MILNRQHEVRVARIPLESFLRRVKRELGLGKSGVTVCLVSDAAMARLNQRFRKKKGPTDVLSFPTAARRPPRKMRDAEIACLNRDFRGKQGPTDVPSFPGISRSGARSSPALATRHSPLATDLGEIAISPATARRYAKKNARKLSNELRVLILHGVLHLLGFDHEADRGEMDRMEQKLRKRLGLK